VTAASLNPPERFAIWDIAKAIGIVLVVYGHCVRGLITGGIAPPSPWLSAFDYAIYTFHMPLFFVISGLFVRTSMAKGPAKFWRNRLLTIAYPYIFWSLLQGSMQLVLAGSGAANTAITPYRLLSILWYPISPFWFLHALFFATVFAYLTRSMNPVIPLICAGIAFVVSYNFMPIVMEDIAYGTLYFCLGMCIQHWRHDPSVIATKTSPFFLWLAFVAVSAVGYIVDLPERLWFPSAIVGMVALAATSASLGKHAHISRWLSQIGQASMAIYVMHILALGAARTLLVHALGISSLATLIPACTFFGIALPFVLQYLTNALGISKFIGLPSSKAPAQSVSYQTV